MRGPRERVLGTLHPLEVIGLERFLRLAQRLLERLPVRFPELRAVLPEGALGRIHERVGLVAHLDLLLALRIVGRVRLGLLHHAVDFVLRETGRRGDRDVLLLSGRLVLRRYVQDSVRIDVECDLDLGNATRRWRNAHEVELAERSVVARQRPLTLHHVDLYRCLAVSRSRKRLALLGRDRCVPWNQRRHHTAECLDAE